MSGDRGDEITELLNAARAGEPGALDRVLPLVYQELRELAGSYFRGERTDHTLQTTALVHEAYLRLVNAPDLSWDNRRHFFGIAARAMRQILVDHARRRGAEKRVAGRQVTLDDNAIGTAPPTDDILAVDEALGRLAATAPRAAQVVELRYFAGLSIEQTAETLDVSVATVKRDWLTARAWLQRELS
ncbi:MAG: sigma-70 family RNA polymerase sigma factor [Gemmatimonadaceae bacterium]|nr:sigma-70 family RNA polymerase sigma factor [Gemmatimonadaceae bacterium]